MKKTNNKGFSTRRVDYRYCYHGNPCWCNRSCIDSLH